MAICLVRDRIHCTIRVKHALYIIATMTAASSLGLMLGVGYLLTTTLPREIAKVSAQTMANRILLETAIHDSRQCVALSNALTR